MEKPQRRSAVEVARCGAGPSDSDRARFGFQRASVCGRPRRCTAEPVAEAAPSTPAPGPRRASCDPEEERPDVSPCGLGTDEELSASSAIEIMPLLQSALGDPDEALPLLRARSAVSKFDFKGRIAELSDQNRQLRAALASKREGHRSLAETLGHLQAELNWKLRSNTAEVQTARAQIDDRSKIAEMLQEAVRAVWREEAACAEQLLRTPQKGGLGLAEAPFEASEQVAALKQCCAAEASRAASAEALCREREHELATLRAELSEQRESALAARQKAARATELVREAGALMRQQEDELRRQHMEERALAAAREQALASQLAKAEARLHALDARSCATPRPAPAPAVAAVMAAASPQKRAARQSGAV